MEGNNRPRKSLVQLLIVALVLNLLVVSIWLYVHYRGPEKSSLASQFQRGIEQVSPPSQRQMGH